ncbi:Isopenicillin N synthase [Quadrisphaera granulorum]|uniref:Isopenicillin N synthase-like dioxygenase n=1 Tax=Quadrisphaera granulorum TaxID=317664 RepID=A0A316A980_9ACTN|nr:2-oxoglutarate and iron-dependent oxygenase domain-containing protein [Quadrisphaera granulorum]PWJ54183.1 isopenicillin N synthase-like dioxygenase [Quadrisphaera granulorum]SZE96322.1 Isopenicillin N synthase [Quadrisphaera granulorum]
MRTIPVIDISAARRGSGGDRGVARAVSGACEEVGFFQVTGHDISAALVEDLFRATRRFFAMPTPVKATVAQPAPDQVRGWAPVGSESITFSLDEESPADLKEKFDIGPEVGLGEGWADGTPEHAPNRWPALPGFREVWVRAYRAFAETNLALTRAAAQGLGVSPEAMAARFDREISMLRALYYPSQPEPPLPGQLRAGVHSDYGAFTLSVAEPRPGALQVLDSGGEWVDVPVIPGAVVVMVGDLWTEWTDHRWPATLHRVVNPRRDVAWDSDRLAVAFYAHPNAEEPVDVLPELAGDASGWPDAPTAAEHLREKYLRQTSVGSPHDPSRR